jgi:hypothetical protein
MVGDHSKGGVDSILLPIGDGVDPFDLLKDGFEEICFIVAFDSLKDGRNPFQTHPGIDTGFGQRLKLTF